ncbi:MAG: hypothetical protein V3W34_19210 [Phycisphaerae bacterium]
MGSTLEALHALQDIERRLATIHGDADSKRRQVQSLRRARQKQESIIQEKKETALRSQVEIDSIDLDVKTRESALAKHRETLNRAKTNKEYAAILTTINTEKADNIKLENRQLALMADVEAIRTEADENRAELSRIAERISSAETGLQRFLDRSASEIKDLESRREDVSNGVSPGILDTFRRVAERHDGEAMAEVLVLDAKRQRHACGGCNMSLTLQQVIGCQQRDDIVLCGSCGKILYSDTSGRLSR